MARIDRPVKLSDPPVTIRSVRASDADALVDYLMKITTQSDNLSFEPDERAMFADEPIFLETLEASVNSLALIALHEDLIVGGLTFIGGKRKKTAHAGEFGLSVDRQWWHRGIARALMHTLIQWARATAVTKINLQVRSDNERAIKLYRGFGFTDEAILRDALCIGGRYHDLLCMGFPLGEDSRRAPVAEHHAFHTRLRQPVHIRALVRSDAPLVLACVEQIARETAYLEISGEALGITVAEEQAIITGYQESDRKIYPGAFTSGGKLVGLLAGSAPERRRTGHACEFSLMVLDAYRSNGIGSALLHRLLLWAEGAGIHRIAMQVHEHNSRAIALYERHGFSTEGHISRAFNQNGFYADSLVMARLLPD